MATRALVLYGLYLALAFGLRVLIQVHRTGRTGLHGLGRRTGATEWIVGIGFVAAALLGIAAPVLALANRVEPIPSLDTSFAHGLGTALALAGIVGTFIAQLAMGSSWRIGVDPEERTALVTDGLFALVRNPIYSALWPTALVVEEPYLFRAHGDAYADYAARVGRFVPGTGRIGKSA